MKITEEVVGTVLNATFERGDELQEVLDQLSKVGLFDSLERAAVASAAVCEYTHGKHTDAETHTEHILHHAMYLAITFGMCLERHQHDMKELGKLVT